MLLDDFRTEPAPVAALVMPGSAARLATPPEPLRPAPELLHLPHLSALSLLVLALLNVSRLKGMKHCG